MFEYAASKQLTMDLQSICLLQIHHSLVKIENTDDGTKSLGSIPSDNKSVHRKRFIITTNYNILKMAEAYFRVVTAVIGKFFHRR